MGQISRRLLFIVKFVLFTSKHWTLLKMFLNFPCIIMLRNLYKFGYSVCQFWNLFDPGCYWLTWLACSQRECLFVQPSLILQIRHHWSSLSPPLCFFCKQHSFCIESQPFRYLFHKIITSQQHVSFTWQDFCIAAQLLKDTWTIPDSSILVLDSMYAYWAAGCVPHIIRTLKTVNLFIETTRGHPDTLCVWNPSRPMASLFGLQPLSVTGQLPGHIRIYQYEFQIFNSILSEPWEMWQTSVTNL